MEDEFVFDVSNSHKLSVGQRVDSTPCDIQGRLQVTWDENRLKKDSELTGEVSICGFNLEVLMVPNNYSLKYVLFVSGQPQLIEHSISEQFYGDSVISSRGWC